MRTGFGQEGLKPEEYVSSRVPVPFFDCLLRQTSPRRVGTAAGWAAFEWTPGVCQYLLMISLTVTTVFVWQCEELSSD